MGYKDMVLGTLTQTAIDERNNVYFNMAQEVEEVYRKAKVFDEVKKLEKETRLYSIAGKEDVELGTEARKIINKYTEDKQND